jgi:transcriptional antiterminator NusG
VTVWVAMSESDVERIESEAEPQPAAEPAPAGPAVPDSAGPSRMEPAVATGEAQALADGEAPAEAEGTGEAPAAVETEAVAEPEVTAEAEVIGEAVQPAQRAEVVPGPAPEAEAGEGVAPAQEPDDGRRWYVVHCYSGYENKVRHNLEQRIETMGMKGKIFDVVVPTEEEIEVREGRRRTVERRVFPGYILVQMILSEDSWYVVRNTPGVTGFVGMGNEPTPLRPEEVAQIIKRMEAEAPRVKVTYKAGQKVRIIDGPFNDFIGTVDEIDMERAKVRVMVSFFGRETPVELDFLQVEKA